MTGPIPSAAVVGGSVVSFAAGLPASQREDVYLSTLYAQRATWGAYRAGLSGNWFDYYCNQLKFLGWDVPRPQLLSAIEGKPLGAGATQHIEARLGEAFQAPASGALAALERNPKALELFESTSLSRDRGIFQMIPCVPNGTHRVEMGVYHCQFQLRRQTSRFLFIERGDWVRSSVEQMTVINFNTLYYATFREKVKRSVMSQTSTYLSALEL
ncbi:hypothetical protein [Pseudomonas ogarae]|uniref:hypothetical protein n=1 Tax=Pseudomonas ogarae (strain DSM 112162 / CECT 30235 / F113) TaxID=1114970 RepID=UPI00023B3B16|nr:hypothetical protein [Pseudomonas ogarae]AEV60684.1 Hypothetical protein PSF113_0648 [Pseudomonas ogarae]